MGQLVLLADDNPSMRDSLRVLLEQHGLEVVLCSTATQTLETAANADLAPAIAVIDVKLPDMPGLELSKQLRANDFGWPIILCSGEQQGADALAGAGAQRFLLKPFQPDQLLNCIWELLEPSDDWAP